MKELIIIIIIFGLIIFLTCFLSSEKETMKTDVSFEQLEKLWPEEARDCPGMKAFGVKLFDYEWLSKTENANRVLDQLENGRMPPGGWPQAKIDVYKAWISGGKKR